MAQARAQAGGEPGTAQAGGDAGTNDAGAGGGRSRLLPLAALLGLLLGGASFYAVHAGLVALPAGVLGGASMGAGEAASAAEAAGEPGSARAGALSPAPAAPVPGDAVFVALEPFIVALGPRAAAQRLRIELALETAAADRAAVEAVVPRIRDVLNLYLRAVEEADLSDPRRMTRLRAQLLRRVRLAGPGGAVRDVLIQSFVLT